MTLVNDKENYVYSRIGMALISAQRVEFITHSLVEHLAEFDKDLFGLTTDEFLEDSKKSRNSRNQTLGMIFKRLKLNPTLVLNDELDEYLKLRNILIHNFWKDYLNSKSNDQIKKIIDYCYNFGKFSERLESFFRGFIYAIGLILYEESGIPISDSTKDWEIDYIYFNTSLSQKKLGIY